MNVEIGTETAQFPEKEYINGIPVAVRAALPLKQAAPAPPKHIVTLRRLSGQLPAVQTC